MLPKHWTNNFLSSKLPEIKAYDIEQSQNHFLGKAMYQHDKFPWSDYSDDSDNDSDNSDSDDGIDEK